MHVEFVADLQGDKGGKHNEKRRFVRNGLRRLGLERFRSFGRERFGTGHGRGRRFASGGKQQGTEKQKSEKRFDI